MTEAEQILQLRQECKEKSILLRQLTQKMEKQATNLGKADAWYHYFQENPEKVFTGKEIVAIMHKNALDD